MQPDTIEELKARYPATSPALPLLPPIGVTVLIRASKFHLKEFEGQLRRLRGRKGLRWEVYNIRGNRVSYPHREWRPDSWRFKDGC